jgi:hypothetical protein
VIPHQPYAAVDAVRLVGFIGASLVLGFARTIGAAVVPATTKAIHKTQIGRPKFFARPVFFNLSGLPNRNSGAE